MLIDALPPTIALPDAVPNILLNLPPPIKLANKSVTILFHNSLLLEWCNSINLINNTKNLLKRFIIYLSGNRNYSWIVQTELMKKKLSKSVFVSRSKIKVFPFFRDITLNMKNIKNDTVTRFLYVTSNSPHKKNEILIKAFKKAKFNTDIETKLSLTINGKNILAFNKKIDYLKLSKYFIIIISFISFFIASKGFSILYLFLIADLFCCSAVMTVFFGFYNIM